MNEALQRKNSLMRNLMLILGMMLILTVMSLKMVGDHFYCESILEII